MRSTLIVIFFTCLVISGCQNDKSYLNKTLWQYHSGHRFADSDFIKFYEPYWDLRGDTVYHLDEPIGIVTSSSEYWEKMTVESLDGEEEGIYLDAAQFLR